MTSGHLRGYQCEGVCYGLLTGVSLFVQIT